MADNHIVLEDVRITFKNFSGSEGQYNRKGDRNFAVLLDEDTASAMEADGWNVKILKPRDEEEAPQPYITVKVNFKGRPPKIVMITSRGKTTLGEDMVNILDWADIRKTDLTLNPYDWDINGKTGITAYLKSMFVHIYEDELDLKYADVPDSAATSLPVDPWSEDA